MTDPITPELKKPRLSGWLDGLGGNEVNDLDVKVSV